MKEEAGPADPGPQRLRQRMLRAKAFHDEYVHHTVWSCPRIVRGLRPSPGRTSLPEMEEKLVSRISLNPRLRRPPHGCSHINYGPGLRPRLNPLEREVRETNQIAYISPDGSLRLTRGQLRGIGKGMLDEHWIHLLCTFPPMEGAYNLGAGGRSPQTLEKLIDWLTTHTRINEQEYTAACLDMFYAGEATRQGIMPAASKWNVALVRADLAEGRERARANA